MASPNQRVYPGSAGAPAYTGNDPQGSSQSSQTSPPDDGASGADTPSGSQGGDTSTSSTSGGSGLVSAGGSDGGINIIGGDTDGNGDGLINVHADAPNGVTGDTLDGVQVDVVNSDSLIDAHAPSLLDATVGDGTVADIVDGAPGATDGLDGLVSAFQGIEVDALDGNNILDAQSPGLVDATVSGSELGGIVDGLGGPSDGQGIQVDALDGTNVADVNAPGIADATVGGAELGNLLDTGGGLSGGITDDVGGFEGIEVNALDGTNIADASAPGIADATVGGAELGNLVGGVDLPVDTGGALVGDLLSIGSSGDLAGLDLGQTLDNVT